MSELVELPVESALAWLPKSDKPPPHQPTQILSTHFIFFIFCNSRFFLWLPETSTIWTVCLIWVRLKVKCPLFHQRRSAHRSRIKESKEKVVESKRKVDQRKVKNPLSKRPDPSKSGGVQEEEGDDGKQGWLEEWRKAAESRPRQGKVSTVSNGEEVGIWAGGCDEQT